MSSLESSAGALQLSLIEAYITDLQDAFTQVLGPGTVFLIPPRCCALLGGEIVLQLDQSLDSTFSDLVSSFPRVAQSSTSILSSWISEDENALHAKVSPSPWKSTRVDGYSGSRVHDTEDNQAISSSDRPQKIKMSKSCSATEPSSPSAPISNCSAQVRVQSPDPALVPCLSIRSTTAARCLMTKKDSKSIER